MNILNAARHRSSPELPPVSDYCQLSPVKIQGAIFMSGLFHERIISLFQIYFMYKYNKYVPKINYLVNNNI